MDISQAFAEPLLVTKRAFDSSALAHIAVLRTKDRFTEVDCGRLVCAQELQKAFPKLSRLVECKVVGEVGFTRANGLQHQIVLLI